MQTKPLCQQPHILVVDDDPNVLEVTRKTLADFSYAVTPITTYQEAIAAAGGTVFDGAILDLKLWPGRDGIALMQELLLINPQLPVLILTGHASIDTAVDAMKKGAYGYLTKPLKPEELQLQLQKALGTQRLSREVETLKTLLQDRFDDKNIIVRSPAMQTVIRQVAAMAKTDSTVTICGESGTGKELIARALHLASQHSQGPFLAVNCGALPEGLLESELFGHVKGAYTDARTARPGLFVQAEGGTIFLDEISETTPALQVKLLRVLQEREVRPVGSDSPIMVNARVITASNRDLKQLVENGSFRDDLFYRIFVLPLYLPPLRARKEDIPPLANHFLHQYMKESGKAIAGFSPAAMQKMMLYSWPGNIREIKNTVERAVILATGSCIEEKDLLHIESTAGPAKPAFTAASDELPLVSYRDAREEFEKGYLQRLMTQVKGNISQAATLADQYRADLYRLMKKHGLKPGDYK